MYSNTIAEISFVAPKARKPIDCIHMIAIEPGRLGLTAASDPATKLSEVGWARVTQLGRCKPDFWPSAASCSAVVTGPRGLCRANEDPFIGRSGVAA